MFPGPTAVLGHSKHSPDPGWVNEWRDEVRAWHGRKPKRNSEWLHCSMHERKQQDKKQEHSVQREHAGPLRLDLYPKIKEEPLKDCLHGCTLV